MDESAPFGKKPVLYVDGKPLPQSFAVARYLANQFGFVGKTPFEKAWVGALADQYKDYFTEIRPFLVVAFGFVEGDKEKLKKEVAKPAIQKFFTILEKQAKASGPGISSGSISNIMQKNCRTTDRMVTSLPEVSDHIGVLEGFIPIAVKDLPLVQKIRNTTISDAKLKEWLDKRPVTPY